MKHLLETKLVLLASSLSLLLFVIYLNLPVPPIYAQQPCTSSNLNQGLISALSISGAAIGNTDQTCVVDPQAAYRDFKVPSYEDLENQFYTLSRSIAKKSSQLQEPYLNFGTGTDNNGIYLQTTDLTVSSVTGSGVQIIFIRGDLLISGNIHYSDTDSTSGLVFIVSGDINIASTVTKVNAVLISSGEICTAYISGSCSNGSAYTPQLVVNGSLISLNKNDLPAPLSAIKFTRNLAINNQPAEVINKQAKYLYILKGGLLTEDLVLTEEDKNYPITQDPSNPPPPPPPPATVSPCSESANPLAIAAAIIGIPSNCVLSI